MRSIIQFVLAVPICVILLHSSSVGLIHSQNNNNDNNIIGQEGDGNDAKLGSTESRETSQNIQCVSGDSSFFSCNNAGINNIGENEIEMGGIGFPLLINNDNIYVRDGNPDTAIGPETALSTASCDPGDALISGTSNYVLSDGSTIKSINHFLRHMGFSWNVQGTAQDNREITVIAKILCYNNPPQ